MPIIQLRDPNKCYESGPFLFWTIIYVAARRYARNPKIFPFLLEAMKRDAFTTITSTLSMSSINALILLCTWMFPDVRFVNDPTSLFSSVCMNTALQLGIHTGKGAHPEFSHNVFQNSFSDEEASFTWAGYNIIAQRVSSAVGIPPLGGLFNQTIQNIIDGRTSYQVPPTFRVLLECQKFCNRLTKTMAACLEESRGVSAHIVQLLEDEWNAVRGLICSERAGVYLALKPYKSYSGSYSVTPNFLLAPSADQMNLDDLDEFNALLVQLEIQTYYMIPLSGYDPEALKRNVMRAYNTAQAVIREALELERKIGFLKHLTHFHFRALLAAGCVVYRVLRSSYTDFIDRKAGEQAAADAISVTRRSTLMEGDLPMRLGNLLEAWSDRLRNMHAFDEQPVSTFFHRLSASVTLDCMNRWKNDCHHRSQPPPTSAPPSDGAAPTNSQGNETLGVMTGAEPLQNIDWTFMDDFEWNFEPVMTVPS